MRISEDQIEALERHGIYVDRETGKVRSLTEAKATLARLSRKAGLSSDEFSGAELAKPIHDGQFELNGKWVSRAELQAAAEAQWEAEHELDDLRRELGLDRPPVEGEDMHARAMQLLSARGIWSPNYEQYSDAVIEVA